MEEVSKIERGVLNHGVIRECCSSVRAGWEMLALPCRIHAQWRLVSGSTELTALPDSHMMTTVFIMSEAKTLGLGSVVHINKIFFFLYCINMLWNFHFPCKLREDYTWFCLEIYQVPDCNATYCNEVANFTYLIIPSVCLSHLNEKC